MSNVEIVTITDELGGTREKVIIDRGNGEYTQMPKSVYDEQQAQAEHFTPMVTDETKTI